ncbi:hypothetical protein [Leeuwenhoekiella nanhaiensis]|uniref:SnoaL-like domain-containing protein n=1 Tax=Leeuwenhoekiella nanhaiensis TaxID=1655491 RepID=A0A2G1VM22_9FLAO|nr:hypothetical protein [Leeuwenhoekiella nanhaiensis]PHQ27808.1 hypothetical protein CJ305_18115 [Leeuwenhoekiella nanhaiensis]
MKYLQLLSLSLFLMLTSSCSTDDEPDDYPEFELQTPDEFSQEEYELYSLFLEEWSGLNDIVVEQKTSAWVSNYIINSDSDNQRNDLNTRFEGYDTQLLADQVEINTTPLFLDNRFSIAAKKVSLISQEELDYIQENAPDKNAPGDDIPFWNYFHQIYPNSQGFISLSRISFNETNDQALFEYSSGCGSLCGYGGLVYFRKENGVWKLIEIALLFIS